MTRQQLWQFTAVGTMLSMTTPAWAVFGVGDIVFDPTALVQTTISALNTGKAVAQQATQLANDVLKIANQGKGLVNDAKNLAQGEKVGDVLVGLLSDYQQSLGATSGLSYDYQQITRQYNQFMSSAAASGTSASLMNQLREANKQAVQAQALYQKLGKQKAALTKAITAVDSADGNVKALQANGQLQAIIGSQQETLMALQATNGRMEASAIAAQLVIDQQAKDNAAKAMTNWGQCTNCNQGLTALPQLR